MDPDNRNIASHQLSHIMNPAAITPTFTAGVGLPPAGITILTSQQCEARRGKWQEDEKDKLVRLVRAHLRAAGISQRNGTGNSASIPWTEIARQHGFRTPKQCRERWDNQDKRGGKPVVITPEIGAWIMENASKPNGHTWAKYGREWDLPENAIKNYFYQESKKRQHKADEERQRIKVEEDRQRQRMEVMRNQHAQRRNQILRSPTHRNPPSSHHHRAPPVVHQYPSHTPSIPDHFAQQDGSSHRHHDSMAIPMHTRCLSNASMPSLASDHDSDPATPRSILEPRLSTPAYPRLPLPLSAGLPPKTEPRVDTYRHDRSASITSQSYQTPAVSTPRAESHSIYLPYHQGRDHSNHRSERPSMATGPWTSNDRRPSHDWLSHGFVHHYQPLELYRSEHNTVGELQFGTWQQPNFAPVFSTTPLRAQTHHAPAPRTPTPQRPSPLELRQHSQEISKHSLKAILND